jgi:hypothetical protein
LEQCAHPIEPSNADITLISGTGSLASLVVPVVAAIAALLRAVVVVCCREQDPVLRVPDRDDGDVGQDRGELTVLDVGGVEHSDDAQHLLDRDPREVVGRLDMAHAS